MKGKTMIKTSSINVNALQIKQSAKKNKTEGSGEVGENENGKTKTTDIKKPEELSKKFKFSFKKFFRFLYELLFVGLEYSWGDEGANRNTKKDN